MMVGTCSEREAEMKFTKRSERGESLAAIEVLYPPPAE